MVSPLVEVCPFFDLSAALGIEFREMLQIRNLKHFVPHILLMQPGPLELSVPFWVFHCGLPPEFPLSRGWAGR
jgi:hypothetical protein